VANKEDKNDRTGGKPANSESMAAPGSDATAEANGRQPVKVGRGRKVGLALIAASLLTITAAGAWLGPDPVTGIAQWVTRGFMQAGYAALLAFFIWTVVRRRRAISYLLLFGAVCAGVAVWDTGAGLYANRVRLEANDMLITFRDTPLNVEGLAESIERNPYVGAYMIMRNAHWELRNRMDDRMADYGASYRTYVENGSFLSVERLQSRFGLWRAFYQVGDLEDQLARIESNPVEADDLLWTVNLLDIDAGTRSAYARDLRDAILTATRSQADLIARERQTLSRIKRSLQVLIDAKGRYGFADGRVVFEDPADAAMFAGTKPATR